MQQSPLKRGRWFLRLCLAVVGVSALCGLAMSCVAEESGERVSVEITPDKGGTLTSKDGKLVLVVPPGAVDKAVTISVLVLPAGQGSPPEDAIGPIYDLKPDGLQFLKPATATLTLSHADLGVKQGEGIQIPTLATREQAQSPLSVLAGLSATHDVKEKRLAISGELRHFTQFIAIKGAIKLHWKTLWPTPWKGIYPVGQLMITEPVFSFVPSHGKALGCLAGIAGLCKFHLDEVKLSVDNGPDGDTFVEIRGKTLRTQADINPQGDTSIVSPFVLPLSPRVMLFCKKAGLGIVHLEAKGYTEVAAIKESFTIKEKIPVACTADGTIEKFTGTIIVAIHGDALFLFTIDHFAQYYEKVLEYLKKAPAGRKIDVSIQQPGIHCGDVELTDEDHRALFQNTHFPCGQGDAAYTACSAKAPPTPGKGGKHYLAVIARKSPIELRPKTDTTVCAVALDADGDPSNNYKAQDPKDPLHDTDRWYFVVTSPNKEPQLRAFDAKGGKITAIASQVRAPILGGLCVFVIPASELGTSAPALRGHWFTTAGALPSAPPFHKAADIGKMDAIPALPSAPHPCTKTGAPPPREVPPDEGHSPDAGPSDKAPTDRPPADRPPADAPAPEKPADNSGCSKDADCPSSQRCQGGRCVPSGASCTSHSDCRSQSPSKPFCDPRLTPAACVDCLSESDCKNTKLRCVAGACVSKTSCTSDADCKEHGFPRCAAGLCYRCTSDRHCSDPARPYCLAGACESCGRQTGLNHPCKAPNTNATCVGTTCHPDRKHSQPLHKRCGLVLPPTKSASFHLCASGLVCYQSFCRLDKSCKKHEDCPSSQRCAQSICVAACDLTAGVLDNRACLPGEYCKLGGGSKPLPDLCARIGSFSYGTAGLGKSCVFELCDGSQDLVCVAGICRKSCDPRTTSGNGACQSAEMCTPYPDGNGGICIAVGTQKLDQSCDFLSKNCAPGLSCHLGACRKSCNDKAKAAACDGNHTCFHGTHFRSCFKTCDPSQGLVGASCPSGQYCRASSTYKPGYCTGLPAIQQGPKSKGESCSRATTSPLNWCDATKGAACIRTGGYCQAICDPRKATTRHPDCLKNGASNCAENKDSPLGGTCSN